MLPVKQYGSGEDCTGQARGGVVTVKQKQVCWCLDLDWSGAAGETFVWRR